MNYLIPTIDVEALRSLSRLGNFDQLIMGKIDNEYFGVPKILDILREHESAGTFYVDFAEVEHGIEKLKFLSALIAKNGSDVQLHIHPQFIADKNRYLLNQYSKKEQLNILQKCINIYNQCTQEEPVSFRAGGYGANDETLELLNDFNFTSDSSYFHKHRWCKITTKPINKISIIKSLTEIPVTIFKNEISYTFLGKTIKQKTLTKKLDIDGCTKDELKKGFDALKNSGIRIIILFLHSFSLFNRAYDYSYIKPNFNNIEKFKFILEYANSNNYKITSVKKINSILKNYVSDTEIFPSIKTERKILNSILTTSKKYMRNKVRGK